MNDLWLRIKLWTKGIFFGALLIYVLLFVANNSSTRVQLWFWFSRKPETSVLLLVLYAFLTGMVVTFLVSTTFKTIAQVRDLRHKGRTDKLEREMAEMRAKAAMLRARPGATGEAVIAPPPVDSSASRNT